MASDELFLAILIVILVVGLLLYLLQRQNTLAKTRLRRAEAVNRLIDKFASAKEVTEFLQTEQGRRLLEDPPPEQVDPRIRVLRFIQIGIVFLFLGVGFVISSFYPQVDPDVNFLREAWEYRFWSYFCFALGAGLLLVALVTSTLLKRWGLLAGRRGEAR